MVIEFKSKASCVHAMVQTNKSSTLRHFFLLPYVAVVVVVADISASPLDLVTCRDLADLE